MRKLIIAIVIGTALFGAAKEKDTIDSLKARAASAERKKLPELYMKLAKLQLDQASDAYGTNPEQARTLVKDSVASGENAASASVETGKRLKKTEIELRELQNRMQDIIRTWAFEDRTAVQSGVKQIESARTRLLDRMFKKK